MTVCPAEELLSGLLDGELSESAAEPLKAHLDSCAECAELYAHMRWLRTGLQTLELPALDDASWQAARSDLAAQLAAEPEPDWLRARRTATAGPAQADTAQRSPRAELPAGRSKRFRRLALAALVFVSVGIGLTVWGTPQAVSLAWARRSWARMNPVLPKDLARPPDSLAESLRVASSDAPSLREFYARPPAAGEARLLTVEVAVHALAHLETELVREAETSLAGAVLPGLLQALLKASQQQATVLDSPELRAAGAANAELLMIGLELLTPGSQSKLSTSAREELALIEAAGGMAFSPHLGRERSYAVFLPRYNWQQNEEHARLFRALVWLGTGLQLSAPQGIAWRPVLMSLALLEARLASGGSARDSWHRLDSSLHFLQGGYQGSGPPEVIAGLTGVFGNRVVLSKLADSGAAVRTALALLPGDFALLPLRRPLPVELRWRLSTGGLASSGVQRRLPRNLDMLALLGQPRALELLAMEAEAAAVSAELETLRSELDPLQGPRWYESRHGAWWLALAPLMRADSFGAQQPAWSSRWLSLAVARAAGVDAGRGEALPFERAAGRVLADPHPEVFANLAAFARFCRRAFEGASEGALPSILARLEAFARWADAVAELAEARLRGTEIDGSALAAELGCFLPCTDAWSLSDIYFSGRTRALYAACGGVDELVQSLPEGGRARGAGLAVFEWLGPADPLWTVADWKAGPRPSRPEWYRAWEEGE